MFSRITHPTDLTAGSRPAFTLALGLALRTGAHLRAVHVDKGPPDWEAWPHASALLERWGHAPDDERVRLKKLHIDAGRVWPALLHDLHEHPPSLLVLATSGRDGWQRWTTRNVAEALVRAGRVPSLVVPLGAPSLVDPATGLFRLSRVLMPVSIEPSAARARGLVDELASMSDGETLVQELSVGTQQPPPFRADPPPVGMSLDKERVEHGDVVETILARAETMRAELVVLTSRGHDGPLDALFGSTAEQVIRRSGRSVLVVPAAT